MPQPTPKPLVNLIAEDFLAVDHGSLIMLTPVSDLASAWCHDHLPDALWFGRSVAIEPRYFDAIYEGIADAGLSIR